MMVRLAKLLAALVFLGNAAQGQEANLRLAVPAILDTAGFAQFIVPRFSLKTSIRIDRVAEGEASDMQFAPGGDIVFVGLGTEWGLEHNGDPRAERFFDWLKSDVGKRTIESFTTPDGEVFSSEVLVVREEVEIVYEGDVALGEKLSLSLCGRCHVVNEKNRMSGMGATPSFGVLRGLPDWDTRFNTFHLLNPHPSFTQIADVTEPFDPTRPPPIVPVEMTLDDLAAILSYVQGIAAADLGAPIQFQ